MRKSFLKKLLILCFWLAIWAGGAYAINQTLLIHIPTPFSTLKALLILGQSRTFYLSVAISLGRILLGFVLAVIIGVFFGVLSYKYSFFADLTEPVRRCVRAVPVASLIIVVFLWFDKDIIPILIAMLMVIPVIWDQSNAAFVRIDNQLIEMASVMGLSKLKLFSKIVWPAVKPTFSAACLSGLGIAWKAGVSAEVICRSTSSLGNLLWVEKNAIAYDEVFALTMVIILLSILMEKILKICLKEERP